MSHGTRLSSEITVGRAPVLDVRKQVFFILPWRMIRTEEGCFTARYLQWIGRQATRRLGIHMASGSGEDSHKLHPAAHTGLWACC